MKKVCLALVLCISFLFLAFSEDLLTHLDEYSGVLKKKAVIPDLRISRPFPRINMNTEYLAGLDRQFAAQSAAQSAALSNESSIQVIEDWAFAYTDLTAVNIPEGVTVIGKGAFANNALSSLMLPRSLQTIDEWAFAHNNISAVVFPANVTSVGAYAFLGNRITDVTLGDFVQLARVAIDEALYDYYIKENKAAGRYIKKGGNWTKE
jgi:hypothetical protein